MSDLVDHLNFLPISSNNNNNIDCIRSKNNSNNNNNGISKCSASIILAPNFEPIIEIVHNNNEEEKCLGFEDTINVQNFDFSTRPDDVPHNAIEKIDFSSLPAIPSASSCSYVTATANNLSDLELNDDLELSGGDNNFNDRNETMMKKIVDAAAATSSRSSATSLDVVVAENESPPIVGDFGGAGGGEATSAAASYSTGSMTSAGGGGHATGQDDGESGRFTTEQESMDLTNEFAVNDDDDDDEQEGADSENEVIEHLRTELEKARKELRLKNEKCEKLSEMQNIVDAEIHELTASLFQEAYKMVADANQKRHVAEKLYKEASGKVDVLQAEVEALKTLVLTSTPSAPNRHLHPQLLASAQQQSGASVGSKKPPLSTFFSSKALSGSSNNNANQRKSSSPFLGHKRNHSDTVTSIFNIGNNIISNSTVCNVGVVNEQQCQQKEIREVDPNYYREFTSWREKLDPTDKSHSFLKRIYEEELTPCLNFPNRELAQSIFMAIERNTVIIERLTEEKPIARTCSLLLMPCTCNYRLKLEDNNEDWLYISMLCRNRITTVCDFLTYLRYMQQGLVKCSLIDCYWEIIRLRKNMALARLGLGVLH